MSEAAVRERKLVVEHVPITDGWITVKIDGFVTRWDAVVTAVCPVCSSQSTCSLSLFIDHLKQHAEDDAAVRIKTQQEHCAPHACLLHQSDDPCTNFKHDKSRGLCATCFNAGCRPPESVLTQRIREGQSK